MKLILSALLVVSAGLAVLASTENNASQTLSPDALRLLSGTPLPAAVINLPMPGAYTVSPFAGRVIVPRAVDEQIVHQPPSNRLFALKAVRPPLQLEEK